MYDCHFFYSLEKAVIILVTNISFKAYSVECQEEAQMQVIVNVKIMLCHQKLNCDNSGVLHEVPTTFVDNTVESCSTDTESSYISSIKLTR